MPVTIRVDAARYGVKLLGMVESADGSNLNRGVIGRMVSGGLRAALKRGNLLSGALYVSLDIFHDAPPFTLDWSQTPVQLPTMPSQVEELEVNANKIMQSLDLTLAGLRGTLTNTDKVLGNAGTLVAPDSLFNAELINMLQQGGGAARSLRVLADYLERHPEALIRGKTGEAKP